MVAQLAYVAPSDRVNGMGCTQARHLPMHQIWILTMLCPWLMRTGMEQINGQKHSVEYSQTTLRIFLWLMIRLIKLNQTKPRMNGCHLRKVIGVNMESVGSVLKTNMGCVIAIKNELY